MSIVAAVVWHPIHISCLCDILAGMSALRPRLFFQLAVKLPLLILLFFTALFISCETDSHVGKKEQDDKTSRPPRTTEVSDAANGTGGDWLAATSLEDLEGTWVSASGALYEYPFRADGRKYLRLAWKERDDTELWQTWAAKNNMDMQTLWQLRFSYLSEMYGQTLPDSDVNGTQYGIKFSLRGGRIYSRTEMLISERLLLVNLGFFRMSPDKDRFIENGSIHLASDKFDDISKGGSIYTKQKKDGRKNG